MGDCPNGDIMLETRPYGNISLYELTCVHHERYRLELLLSVKERKDVRKKASYISKRDTLF